ncbi:MAG: DUF2336 domain-containing protein [Sphingomonadales bacterium]
MTGPQATQPANGDAFMLLEVAKKKTTEGRNLLARTISDLFSDRSLTLTDHERSLMFEILTMLIHDVEMTVRKTLADQLKDIDDAPLELIRTLANSDISVAAPVLTHSNVLKDSDLIEIIRHRTLEHQMAIAIRQTVNEDVSDALVEVGHASVITTLLKNENAQISESTLAYLVEQSERIDSFQEPVLRRKDLPPSVARRMFFWVSAALRPYILKNFDVDPSVIDDLLAQVSADAADEKNGDGDGKSKAATLTEELLREGLATPAMLLPILREGEVTLFIQVLATLLGIGEKLAKRILFEPGGEGLAIACKYLDLDESEFKEIFHLSRVTHAVSASKAAAESKKVLELFGPMTQPGAAAVVRKWRRSWEYLAAVRALELGK